MPLKAVVNGKTIVAPDLSGDEWADLKLQHARGLPVTMACCGAPGHLRVSRSGTRHFYHAVDTGCAYAEESKEHLAIKEQVYCACRAEHWEATVEYPAPDRSWIADVYAEKDGRKIVFEIQISAIPPDELSDRDRRYRNAGIEAYWLLDGFLGRSRDFTGWYDPWLHEGDPRPGKTVPYLDPLTFATGPENHIFIPRGIRTIGLDARKQTVFSTNNPAIPLPVWVGEVLKGNYLRYLDETAATLRERCRLKRMAAPLLERFRDFYRKIVRDRTYRKRADLLSRALRSGGGNRDDKERQQAFREISSELDWVEREYRSFTADSSGLFIRDQVPGRGSPQLIFRLESEQKIRNLQECIRTLDRWEESFTRAMDRLERQTGGQV